jgi:ferredoxin
MSAVVNKEKCDGCGECVEVCPISAIQIQNGKANISDNCIDCGICVRSCPNEAISLTSERPTYDRTISRNNYHLNRKRYTELRIRGRGFGRRRGRGYAVKANFDYPSQSLQNNVITSEENIDILREQAKTLEDELRVIKERLKEINSEKNSNAFSLKKGFKKKS